MTRVRTVCRAAWLHRIPREPAVFAMNPAAALPFNNTIVSDRSYSPTQTFVRSTSIGSECVSTPAELLQLSVLAHGGYLDLQAQRATVGTFTSAPAEAPPGERTRPVAVIAPRLPAPLSAAKLEQVSGPELLVVVDDVLELQVPRRLLAHAGFELEQDRRRFVTRVGRARGTDLRCAGRGSRRWRCRRRHRRCSVVATGRPDPEQRQPPALSVCHTESLPEPASGLKSPRSLGRDSRLPRARLQWIRSPH